MAPEALEQVFVIGGVKGRNGVRDSKPHAKDESKQGKEIPSMQGWRWVKWITSGGSRRSQSWCASCRAWWPFRGRCKGRGCGRRWGRWVRVGTNALCYYIKWELNLVLALFIIFNSFTFCQFKLSFGFGIYSIHSFIQFIQFIQLFFQLFIYSIHSFSYSFFYLMLLF